MAKTWIKLYTEALHDRKMRKLSRFDKSVFYDLLLLAGIDDNGGILPEIEDIALELDLKKADAMKSIANLLKSGILTKDSNDNLLITHFQDRQEANLSNYEKVKRYRENQKKVINDNQNDNPDDNQGQVINDNPDDIKMITIDKEEEVEEEVEVEEELKERDREKETRALKTASKHKHGQFGHVLLTDAEYGKLCKRFGASTDSKIQNLDDYLQNNRKKHYDDHYLTLLKWAEKDDKTAPQPVRQEPAKRESWVELAERMQSQKNAVIAEADAITGFGGAA